ncbi:retinoblastoma-like protein 1 isoform X2 [Corythoichthys intestinalis]|uniref:retinoblastoma-like protein 1 isoform X2 n=1 Tax=Corythoichthys intestinalis TaxID=161448 RepID=UPI0025A688F3|nr:retinoblastoma-like protein 1 isoform X2 [Corythoichthys intestinalis]XP_061814316.1 retinoblastoma-like protein 1 [Nerophis lumbriciformis]
MRGEESSDSESGRMEESVVRRSLETLCQELNMDERTATEAMDNFTAIWNTYTLEGELVHWLACALYAACRKGSVPTVGKGFMEGNCVSLTRILRTAKLSLMEFFSKMRKWSDMSNLSENFRLRVERLERNFEVSTVIFRKFEPIFAAMFRGPCEAPPPPTRQPRGRKHRRLPCHTADVFKFCWTLFVYTKGNFHMIGDDLVNSYHLLLCCLDLVFGNALMCANRKELINPAFIGEEVQACADEASPCVLERLCELHDGLVVEAKGIKQHYFKPYMHKLFCRQILKGNADLLTELLDPHNFIDNNKALNREYEEYVLTVGDFDERIFLDADADEEIGTPRKSFMHSAAAGTGQSGPQKQLQQHVEKSASLAPSTPLTGRGYLKEKDAAATPVSSATQSVSRLQSMVAGLRTAPSEQLLRIFKSCSRDPTEAIVSQVKTLGQTFKEHYTNDSGHSAGSHVDFAKSRLKLAEILFYKVLENVLMQETKRLQGKDMSALLEQDIFHCSLLACCLEVVLFSYSSQRTFPWIIDIFKLAPFYFFKVIEVFIRSEEGLSRDMVKHLNLVEEQVLESRAWTSDSALWSALRAAGDKVPTVEEVNFSSSLDSGGSATPGTAQAHLPLVALSPIVHPRIREVRSGMGSARKEVPVSPLAVQDRYSSPTAGSAKRRLFGDDPPATVAAAAVTSPTKRLTLSSAGTLKIGPQAGQTTVLSIPLQGGGGERTITLIPVQPCDTSSGVTAQFLLTASPGRPLPVAVPASPTPSESQVAGCGRPQRTGSLALFFRKLYHLASVRLRDLCARLDISSELRAKIWTGLEHSLVHATELMRDRHLDQMLLCAVYIIAKISKETHTFQDIMKCYRSQPQASSHVYRSVLLQRSPGRRDVSSSDDIMEAEPTESQEERGDLIQFYNNVYVLKMKSYALRYASFDNRTDAPPLSPFPSVRCHPPSPRRVSQRHSLYVSPHKGSAGGPAPHAFTYRFNSSPSKELSDINRMLRQGCNGRKRALTAEGQPAAATPPCHSPSKRACPDGGGADILFKRLQDVVSERQSH